MCAWQAAQLSLQMDSFSCGDAHAFNRNSSSQVTAGVHASDFQVFASEF